MWAGELSSIEGEPSLLLMIPLSSLEKNLTQHAKTTLGLLVDDIRNNSAWNHRFFIVFDTLPLHSPKLTSEEFKAIVDREIEFTKQQILKAPNNPSAWNYLRGSATNPLADLDAFFFSKLISLNFPHNDKNQKKSFEKRFHPFKFCRRVCDSVDKDCTRIGCRKRLAGRSQQALRSPGPSSGGAAGRLLLRVSIES